MRSREYNDYIHSQVWRDKVKKRIQIDNGQCQMCGCRGTRYNPLQVHHLRGYRDLGHEDVDRDLVTLCKSCHDGAHRMLNRITDSNTGRHGWTNDQTDRRAQSVIQLSDNEILYFG